MAPETVKSFLATLAGSFVGACGGAIVGGSIVMAILGARLGTAPPKGIAAPDLRHDRPIPRPPMPLAEE